MSPWPADAWRQDRGPEREAEADCHAGLLSGCLGRTWQKQARAVEFLAGWESRPPYSPGRITSVWGVGAKRPSLNSDLPAEAPDACAPSAMRNRILPRGCRRPGHSGMVQLLTRKRPASGKGSASRGRGRSPAHRRSRPQRRTHLRTGAGWGLEAGEEAPALTGVPRRGLARGQRARPRGGAPSPRGLTPGTGGATRPASQAEGLPFLRSA